MPSPAHEPDRPALAAVPDPGPADSGVRQRDGRSQGGEAEVLLQRVARGDEDAFERFYDLFASRVFGLVRRVVRDPGQAEEVAQEVFLEVWRRASRFDESRGSATGWVLTLAHARAVDRVRSAQAATDREVRVAAATTERDVDTVVEEVEQRFERRAVQRCLGTLTDRQRESITLAYYSGYTYREVAELLSTPLPTVKTRLRDGLIRLRDCLGVAS
ncbi:sigma-70 family RNA polymerase sigma factor [Nakamurella flava]|uniref:Sigma-70 family RNA polymerase sigma factor n=1 Tax=Nakamurella flava TaxID=2576308 RepID=A0A4U6QCH2_9ACTN|nr:ECF RNA polymerase sigma factor SigK [Nakamurella flava]TKV57794.1 sigma-70 family RNA polymerase sigma factor [Nakamurella flava]